MGTRTEAALRPLQPDAVVLTNAEMEDLAPEVRVELTPRDSGRGEAVVSRMTLMWHMDEAMRAERAAGNEYNMDGRRVYAGNDHTLVPDRNNYNLASRRVHPWQRNVYTLVFAGNNTLANRRVHPWQDLN